MYSVSLNNDIRVSKKVIIRAKKPIANKLAKLIPYHDIFNIILVWGPRIERLLKIFNNRLDYCTMMYLVSIGYDQLTDSDIEEIFLDRDYGPWLHRSVYDAEWCVIRDRCKWAYNEIAKYDTIYDAVNANMKYIHGYCGNDSVDHELNWLREVVNIHKSNSGRGQVWYGEIGYVKEYNTLIEYTAEVDQLAGALLLLEFCDNLHEFDSWLKFCKLHNEQARYMYRFSNECPYNMVTFEIKPHVPKPRQS